MAGGGSRGGDLESAVEGEFRQLDGRYHGPPAIRRYCRSSVQCPVVSGS